jgi:uncharacterized membrane protein
VKKPKTKDLVRQLRSFGFIIGGGFGLIGLWPVIFHGLQMRLWAMILAAALISFAIIYPKGLRPAYRVWMITGEMLGWLNSMLILGVVFFLLFVPFGFVMRLFRRDPMRRQKMPDAGSYRIARENRPGSHMEHQY